MAIKTINMKYSINLLKKEILFIDENLKTVRTEVMKNEYLKNKKDLEFSIKTLEKSLPMV